jgi:hypothetical protein
MGRVQLFLGNVRVKIAWEEKEIQVHFWDIFHMLVLERKRRDECLETELAMMCVRTSM